MTAAAARGLFVTGTDTGVGKTWVSVALLRALRQAGLTAVGMKPVASGCEFRDGRWVNEDALLLRAHSALQLPYEQVNPYAFAPPVSPHIAAALAGISIDLDAIVAQYGGLARLADVVVVEGVGGWLAPLDATRSVADLAALLRLPVILVVGVRLGCINHALLTARAIAAMGLDLAGWVANVLDADTAFLAENLGALGERLDAPCLGILPYAGGLLGENWLDSAERALAAGLRHAELLQRLGA